MAEVASAFVTLVPRAVGFAKGIERQIGGDVEKAGQSGGKRYAKGMGEGVKGATRSIFAPLAAAAAGVGVVDFFKDAISGASDLNESATKISAIFGDGAKAVQNFASGGAKALGQTKNDVLDAAATFGTFGKAAGLSGQDLASFSTGFASLSTDLASFNNTTPEQAVEAIGSALRGEAEPMRQFGVLLDDATLRNSALRLGLIKTTKEALTPQQKVLAAQAEIYRQTKDAQGDFARTSGGLANQQRILTAQFSDFESTLGSALLPLVVKLATFMNDRVAPALTMGADAVRLFVGAFTGEGADVESPWMDQIIDAGAQARAVFDSLRDGLTVFFDALRGRSEIGEFDGALRRVNDAGVSLQYALVSLGGFVRKTLLPSFMTLASAVMPALGVAFGALLQSVTAVLGFMSDHTSTVQAIAVAFGLVTAATYAHSVALAINSGALRTWFVQSRVVQAATKAWAAIQWVLNAALSANPIGVVIVLVAALAAGLVYAYKKSDTFRAVVDKAFKAVGAAGKFMWEKVLKPAFRFMVSTWLTAADAIVTGAATAFGWIPGLGPKLKEAKGKFETFKRQVNEQLDGIDDKDINVLIKASGLSQNTVIPGRGGGSRNKSGFAKGGSVFGPGTETSDDIPAWLSKNEHVWTAAEVRGAGGHSQVERLRAAARMGRLPAFAEGGRVIDISAATSGMGSAYAAVAAEINKAAAIAAERALDGKGRSYRGTGGKGGSRGSLIAFGRFLESRGFNVSEGPPPFGPVHRVHTRNSRHYVGRAIDVNKGAGTSAREQRYIDGIVGLAKNYGLSAIWRAPGHYNHAHFQYDKGGMLAPGATGSNNLRKPERVLTPSNTQSFDRLVSMLERGGLNAGGPTFNGPVYTQTPEAFARMVIAEQRLHEALHPTFG